MRQIAFAVLFLFVLLTGVLSFGQGVRVGPDDGITAVPVLISKNGSPTSDSFVRCRFFYFRPKDNPYNPPWIMAAAVRNFMMD